MQLPALENPVIRAWVLFQSEQNPAAGQKCCQNKHLYFQHIYDMDKCILFKEPFSAQSYFLVPTLTDCTFKEGVQMPYKTHKIAAYALQDLYCSRQIQGTQIPLL